MEIDGKQQSAKYYQITARGKRQLAADRNRWLQMVQAIGAIMRPSEEQS
jgi:PadR family transcriptional regulator PadR